MSREAHTAGSWDEVEAEVLSALQPVIERQVKAASERLYDDLLTTTQDYLAENLRWNIASRLESAERARRIEWGRAEAAERRLAVLEAHVARVSRLMTSEEWGRPVNSREAVEAMDREVLAARAAIKRSNETAHSATGEG